jgi:hypothetical protein
MHSPDVLIGLPAAQQTPVIAKLRYAAAADRRRCHRFFHTLDLSHVSPHNIIVHGAVIGPVE